MRITKEELIEINQSFGGNIRNSNSLDYAINCSNQTGNAFKGCAFLIRAIVVDHTFSDGNKRTAIYVCTNELGDAGNGKLSRLMVSIAEKNIHDLNKIEKMLRRCYQKN